MNTRRVVDLDKEILQIQKSTRTLFRVFSPIHEWFRMHSRLYYVWSLKPYARVVHWSVLLLYCIALPLIFGPSFVAKNVKVAVAAPPPGWNWENPKPAGVNLNCVYYDSIKNRIFVGGANGLIQKYDLITHEWSTDYSGTSNNITSIAGNGNAVWAVGDSGTILKYENEFWSAQNSLTGNGLKGIAVASEEEAWAVGQGGIVLHTINSGDTWVQQYQLPSHNQLNSISIAESTIWVVGQYGTIIKSNDGGDSWSSESLAYGEEGETPDDLLSVNAITSGSVWATGAYSLLKRTNGIWGNQATQNSESFIRISAFNENNAWIIGAGGGVEKTNNGSTWSAEINSSEEDLLGIVAIDADTAWAVGTNGTVLKKAAGTGWVSQTEGTLEILTDVEYVNEAEAWAVSAEGTILKRTTEGTWETMSAEITTRLMSITVLDEQNIWAVGELGGIYKKDPDNDNIWAAQTIEGAPISSDINAVVAIDEENVWAVGNQGRIFKKNIENDNWANTQTLGITSFYDVSGAKNEAGTVSAWAVGTGGKIIRLGEDGTWADDATFAGVTLKGVFAVDVDTAWAVGYSGKIYKKANEESEWTLQPVAPVSTSANLFSISAIDESTAWIGGATGLLLKTTDGGTTWIKSTIGPQTLSSISAYDSKNIIAVGPSGLIMRYSSPSSATATKLRVSIPNEVFKDGDSSFVGSPTTSFKAGQSIPVQINAVNGGTNLRDWSSAYVVSFSTTDPSDTNPSTMELNGDHPLNEECGGSPTDPCGFDTAEFIFRTPTIDKDGNPIPGRSPWKITAHEMGGTLTDGISSDINIRPGDPYAPALSSTAIPPQTQLRSGVATNASDKGPMRITLKDQFGNETNSDSNPTTVTLSSDGIGKFSTDGITWTATEKDVTIPAGLSELDFYYLNYSANTTATITAYIGQASSTYSFTILPGSIGGSTIIADPNPAVAGSKSNITTTISSDTKENRTVTIYSDRSTDEISTPSSTNEDGTAGGYVKSNLVGTSNISVKVSDPEGDVWLLNPPSVMFIPGAIERVELTSTSEKSIPAGAMVRIKPAYYDLFNNLITSTSDKITITSDDQQAVIPSTVNKFGYNQITLKSAGLRKVIFRDDTTDKSAELEFDVSFSLSSVINSVFETNKRLLIIGEETAKIQTTLLDQFNNPIPNKKITITNDSELGSLDSNERQTDSGGQAKFVYTPKKEGKDTLTAFMPDNNDSSKNIAFSQIITIENKPASLVNQVASLVDTLQNSEVAQAIANVAKNVVAAAGALGLLPIIANVIGSAPSVLHAINYGISLTLEALGIRKKRRTWGRVYDSTTGKGIDLVLVRLYDQKTMKLKGTIVTDLKGRYHFSPDPGVYVISVTKQGYIFPTQIFAQYGISKIDKSESNFNQSYVGQPINFSASDNLLNIEIPIDPVNKKASFLLKLKIFSIQIFDLITFGLSYIFIPALILGSVMSVFSAIIVPDRKNIILSIIYIIITLIYIIGKSIKNRHYSQVVDSRTKKPIPQVVVSLFDKEYGTLKETRITDKFGRYSIYAPKGSYYLKAEKSGYVFSTSSSYNVARKASEKKISSTKKVSDKLITAQTKKISRYIYTQKTIIFKSPEFIREVIEGHEKD